MVSPPRNYVDGLGPIGIEGPPIRLYIHVPFCEKKCPYCHFYSVVDDEGLRQHYVQALLRELQEKLLWIGRRLVVSVYFGGGTPFNLGPTYLNAILDTIGRASALCQDAEITIEANPNSVVRDYAVAYAGLGINRISLGAQSFDPALCAALLRSHGVEETFRAVDIFSAAGFSNLSLDLMYDLPKQDLATWHKTLNTAVLLPITHVSLYNLTIEPKTEWFPRREALRLEMPDEELSTEMYLSAGALLHEAGFGQYEISAFAKPGYQSRHNVGYWNGDEFLGFGPSAFSFFDGQRFSNAANIKAYCRFPSKKNFQDNLSAEERFREFLALGLRMNNGVKLDTLKDRYGPMPAELTKTLTDLIAEGLLEHEGKAIRLTGRGRLLYDSVAVEII